MGCATSQPFEADAVAADAATRAAVAPHAAAAANTTAVEGTTHRIYQKTEPGGRVLFGKLRGSELLRIAESLKARKVGDELLDLITEPPEYFQHAEGVSNLNRGDGASNVGNEGIVHSLEAIAVPIDADGLKVEGVYLVHMSLSKVSIDFEFLTTDGLPYAAAKLTELSVPVDLPGCVECRRYGDIGDSTLRLVTGFEYAGARVREYEEDCELVDRGYDTTLVLFRVPAGSDDCEMLCRRCMDEDGEVAEVWSADTALLAQTAESCSQGDPG